MILNRFCLVSTLAWSLVLICPFASGATTSERDVANHFSKVMIVIFENANYENVINQPFFGKLASEGANLKNFHAETHPSQPNYIALISGGTNGSTSDLLININATNVTDLLESKGKTWKVYAEGYPGDCYTGMQKRRYVRRHNPFISFKSIQADAEKCSHIVDASELDSDLQAGALPDYSFFIPDLNDDGHDTNPKYADTWYTHRFGPLLDNPKFMDGMLLVSTFDESGLLEPTNHIYTSLYGESVKAGFASNVKYNHYSLLRMIEDNFDLGTIATGDATATAVTDVWK